METESGAKIAIRGKGSVKEGKGRSDAAHSSNQEEDLHCLIMADTEEKVNKAKKLIHNIIETVSPLWPLGQMTIANIRQAASIPEGQNELKRNQLRELAALNGTLRDDENQACQNCEYSRLHIRISYLTLEGGQIGHRKYDCPEQRNFTANIICRVCGSAGHMARDCTVNKGAAFGGSDPVGPGPGGSPSQAMVKGGFDSEYASLMAELGETGKGPGPDSGRGPWGGGVGDTTNSSNVPPWRRAEVWQSALGSLNTQQNSGYRPPQPGYGGYPGGGAAPGYGQQGYSGYPQASASGYSQSQDYSNYAQYYQGQYAQQTSS